MRPHDDTRNNVMILAALTVGILASNFDGSISSLMMFVSFLVLVCIFVPSRLRMGASLRRHDAGIQLLRYLASSSGQTNRLQHDVIDSYVRSFGGDRLMASRSKRTTRMADVDRLLSRISANMDPRETDTLIKHVDMMRRTRSEHAPLAVDTYERIGIALEKHRDSAMEREPDRISVAFATVLGSFGEKFGVMAPSPLSPTRLVSASSAPVRPSEPAETPAVHPDRSGPVLEALSESEDPTSIELIRRLRPLLRPEGREGLDGDLLLEADAATRDLCELAIDFHRSRSRTRTGTLDADFSRIADGVAGRLEDLRRRQSARDADGFSERARFIEQRHGLTTDRGLDTV